MKRERREGEAKGGRRQWMELAVRNQPARYVLLFTTRHDTSPAQPALYPIPSDSSSKNKRKNAPKVSDRVGTRKQKRTGLLLAWSRAWLELGNDAA